jgi:hypothetical protein
VKTIEHSVVINKSIEETFVLSFNEIKVISGNFIEKGSVLEVKGRFRNKEVKTSAEVVDYVKNHLFVYEAKTPFLHQIINQYEEVEGGTRITRRMVVKKEEISGIVKLLSPVLLNTVIKRTLSSSLDDFKDLLER